MHRFTPRRPSEGWVWCCCLAFPFGAGLQPEKRAIQHSLWRPEPKSGWDPPPSSSRGAGTSAAWTTSKTSWKLEGQEQVSLKHCRGERGRRGLSEVSKLKHSTSSYQTATTDAAGRDERHLGGRAASFTKDLCSQGSNALTASSEISPETSQARSDHAWMGQRVFYWLTVTSSRSEEVIAAPTVTMSHHKQPPRRLGHCFDTAQRGRRCRQKQDESRWQPHARVADLR